MAPAATVASISSTAPALSDGLHVLVGESPRLLQPPAVHPGQLGQGRPQLVHPGRVGRERRRGRARGSTGSRSPSPCCGPDVVSPVSSWKCRVSWVIRPPAFEHAAWRMISDRTARSTLRSELTFFVSVRVPHASPGRLSEVFTSQRSEPCSIRTSETPSERMTSRSSVT